MKTVSLKVTSDYEHNNYFAKLKSIYRTEEKV